MKVPRFAQQMVLLQRSFGAGVISSSVLEAVLQCAAVCLVYCRLTQLPGSSSFTGLHLHSVWFRHEYYRWHR